MSEIVSVELALARAKQILQDKIMESKDINPSLRKEMVNSIEIQAAKTLGLGSYSANIVITAPHKESIFGNDIAFMPAVYNDTNNYKRSPVYYYGEYKPNGFARAMRLDQVRGKGSHYVEKAITEIIASLSSLGIVAVVTRV